MELESQDALNVLVIWRDKHLNVKVNPNSKVLEFGEMLRKLTNVKSDTLRLLVPQSRNKSARMVSPFSDEHSNISLLEASVLEGKPIRMMGACDDEVKEVSQSSIKSDSRILGFDEEEKRLKQRMWNSQQASLKLPQGTYIFCDFRTLNLPGIELNPPPSEALRRMHMLACDPGIIAIMNKHRWRVGIMTEMAPEGYVGISPKCILGFNKNQGEEISLRLRTDDLKGFRKYESIKKTLLHELAHMVYSEHDANFYALDKQLNQEAASLDWTKSRSHTLSGRKVEDYYGEEELNLGVSGSYTGQKLGGTPSSLASARVSPVAAAYNRILNSSSEESTTSNDSHLSDSAVEPDPDDEVEQKITAEPDPDDMEMIETYAQPSMESLAEPNANALPSMRVDTSSRNVVEPDPDESLSPQTTTVKNYAEPDPDDSSGILSNYNSLEADEVMKAEPDPDDQRDGMNSEVLQRIQEPVEADEVMKAEPDPDDQRDGMDTEVLRRIQVPVEADEVLKGEPDPDDGMNSEVLQRIEEPVAALCSRIQRAIKMLRSEATPVEASSALQTLFKIIRNVIEHPEQMKFRRLRKSNPQIQRNVVNYKAAMEVLTTIGFSEDDVSDEVGRKETYLVLKRNDPGLLWLAKSSLEVSMA